MTLIGSEIPGHRPPWIPFFQRLANPDRTGPFRLLMSKRWFRHSSAGFGGCFTEPSLIDGEFFQLFIEPMLAAPRRISGQTRFLMGIDWRLVDALKVDHAKIKAPVLLVWGEDDPVFPVELAREMATQLGNCAGFVALPGGKLFVHEEMPDAVLPVLLDFLLGDHGSGRIRAPGRHASRPPGGASMTAVNAAAAPSVPVMPPASPGPRSSSHPLLDPGGAAVLLVLFVGFIAPTLAWVRWGNLLDGLPRQAFELRVLLWTVLLSLLLPVLQVGRGASGAAADRRSAATAIGNRVRTVSWDGYRARTPTWWRASSHLSLPC